MLAAAGGLDQIGAPTAALMVTSRTGVVERIAAHVRLGPRSCARGSTFGDVGGRSMGHVCVSNADQWMEQFSVDVEEGSVGSVRRPAG